VFERLQDYKIIFESPQLPLSEEKVQIFIEKIQF
jgi:hypothetical protein